MESVRTVKLPRICADGFHRWCEFVVVDIDIPPVISPLAQGVLGSVCAECGAEYGSGRRSGLWQLFYENSKIWDQLTAAPGN